MAGKQILLAGVATVGFSLAAPSLARADEGGVGFWLPGQLGTLAAVPQTPGWKSWHHRLLHVRVRWRQRRGSASSDD